jgi:uncharacterized protein YyaL (SSP411 family)
VPLLAHRTEVDGLPAAYVCRAMVCERPVTDPAELSALMASDRTRLQREASSYTPHDDEA